MMSKSGVVSVLLLVLISSTAAQLLYRAQEVQGEPETAGHLCVFPCRVKTQDGNLLPIPPKVRWQRLLDDEYVDLTDERWLDSDRSISFSNNGFAKCKDMGTQYNCDFVEEYCYAETHGGTYQCLLTNQHDRKMYSHLVNYNLGGQNDPNITTCFAPVPLQSSFTATYNESAGLTLGWRTGSSQDMLCEDHRISVLVRSYSSYRKYTYFTYSPDQVIDFVQVPAGKNKFFVPIEDVRLGNYYVFDVRVTYTGNSGSESEEVITPLYYFGEQEDPLLTVPEKDVTEISVAHGELVELRCEGQGSPVPDVELLFGVVPIVPTRPGVVTARVVATTNNVGKYSCVAFSTYVPPEGGAQPTHHHKTYVLSISDEPEEDSELLCTPHGQTLCTDVLGGSHVLINTTDTELNLLVDGAVESLNGLTDNVTSLGHNASFSQLVRNCLDLAKAMLCHSAYPHCDLDPLLTRPVCARTCAPFLPGGVCEGVVDLQQFPGVSEMFLARCDDRVRPAGESPECVYVPLEPTLPAASWCQIGDGESYAGDISTTVAGDICQVWGSQAPHLHFFQPELLHRSYRECRNPGGAGERPWCYTLNEERRWDYCDVPQCTTCVPYSAGITCSHLRGYEQGANVFINRHELEWGQDSVQRADKWMHTVLSRLGVLNPNLTPGCRDGIQELLCHTTLPLCAADGNSPSSLCNQHCKLHALLQVCPQELLRRLEGEMDAVGMSFQEPVCHKKGHQCLPVQTSLSASATTPAEPQADTCYDSSDNGLSYLGSVSVTTSGAVCQVWGPQFPELEGNPCRNPGQVGRKPWCFTDQESGQWEYCSIPNCNAMTSTDGVAATNPKSLSTTGIGLVTTFVIIGVGLIFISLVIAIIMAVYCRRKQQEQAAHRDRLLHKLHNKREWDYVVNQTYVQVGGPPAKLKEAVENFPQISKASIKYVRQIGQGNFGVVFYARAEGIVEDEKVTDVAVKTMKEENSTEGGLEDFIREAKLMFGFNHANIVKIFGVCVEDLPYYLVFEYMDKGDLAHFLRANASSLQRRLMNPFDGRARSRTESTMSDEPPTLTVEQLTDICRQIASGMNYLAINNHVHRDLACRNCLVKSCDWQQTDSGLIIKIGDFGMSQNLYSSDYYRVRGQAVLPVRWMSPEAIIYGKFSTESDVWSFGVVMWEVFSFAMQPYYGTSNEEVTECIRRHKLLAKPSDCPSRIYNIMEMCWTMQPKLRPSFNELLNVLSDCRQSVSSSEPSDSQSMSYSGEDSENDDAFYDEDSVKDADA